MILGDDENKNANCIVDKKIQELESEIKKLSCTESKLLVGTLAQAVTNLNSRIRNQGYSAAQTHFSRDENLGVNLSLDDDKFDWDKIEKREYNHSVTAKSEASQKRGPTFDIDNGDIVYVKHQGSKHEAHVPHIVLDTEHESKFQVKKFLHSHQSSKAGPAFSSKTSKVDPKFLYPSLKNKKTP